MHHVESIELKIKSRCTQYSISQEAMERWKVYKNGLPHFTIQVDNIYGFGRVKVVEEGSGEYTIVSEDTDTVVRVSVWEG